MENKSIKVQRILKYVLTMCICLIVAKNILNGQETLGWIVALILLITYKLDEVQNEKETN